MVRNKNWSTGWCIAVIAMVLSVALPGVAIAQDETQIDCSQYENSALAEPLVVAKVCGSPEQPAITGTGRFPGDPAYSLHIGGVGGTLDEFITFPLPDMGLATQLGFETAAPYAMDFDQSATTLWALDSTSLTLGTIDIATGAYTPVVACPGPGGGTWSGLTIDAMGTFWASSPTDLYTIDPGTGAATLVGPFNTPGALVIDIAINALGEMYAHDIGDDIIYSVNTATGAATAIGSTGMAANYAQAMDFDFSDGTLYAWVYTGGGTGGFCTIDLATGLATMQSWRTGEWVGAIAVPAGDFEPLTCNGTPVSFEAGVIPDDWSVTSNAGPGGEWLVSMDNSSPFWTIPPTPYGSYYASANDDVPPDPSDGSADYLYSNVFDLSDAATAELSFGYFYTGQYGQIAGGLQVSPDGGQTWDSEIIVPAGPAWQVHVQDLTAYAGLPAVQVRFHSDDGGAWATGFAVDGIALTCAQPAITLSKVVDTTVSCPAGADSITVAPGTDVYYCYTVENTGNVSLTTHDLVDDQLGTLLTGVPQILQPGDTFTYDHSTGVPIAATTVNVGTWTAYIVGTPVTASAQDDAQVIVSAPAPLLCNGGAVGFDAGIPPDWTVVNNAPGNPVEWASIADCGEGGNYTGGVGEAACASSDFQGGGSGLYDTELIPPAIDLTGYAVVSITYDVNYQNFALVDFLNLDVSTDGGSNWTNVLSWNEDHGSFRGTPGVVVNLDLSAYGMQSGVLLRWHYFDPTGPGTSTDWYAQIDNVELICDVPVELQSLNVE